MKFILLILMCIPASVFGSGGREPRNGDARQSEPKLEEYSEDREEELDYEAERKTMVRSTIEARGVTDPEVLEAMRSVPRHKFVPEDMQRLAYSDQPLPIGHGQTISQPYIVAYMTEVLDIDQGDRVLEVGTGSGYQAAVLAEITDEVYTIEIIDELAESARETLNGNGYGNVKVKNADGYYGWQENAPFDAIIVTAAAGHVPPPLIEQLKPGGRIVIPIGGVYQVQQLTLLEKRQDGSVSSNQLMAVRFVPFTGEAAGGESR